MTNDTTSTNQPALIAYHAPAKGSWVRIGAAWPHRDGKGFALELDLVPTLGGRVVLRERGSEPEQQPEGGA